MKCVITTAPGHIEVTSRPNPTCPTDGAIIKVDACGICGTDIKIIQRGHKDLCYPRILGHEIVGEILKVDGSHDGFSEGDKVQIWPGSPCGNCRPCKRGYNNQCKRIGILGFNEDGGLAEQLAVSANTIDAGGLNIIDYGIDPALYTLAEPLGCCINAFEMSHVARGDRVLVIGGGPLGCLNAFMAKHNDAEFVIISEQLEGRRKIIEDNLDVTVIEANLKNLHETVMDKTAGEGMDVILMATPDVDVNDGILKMLASNGRLCVFSGPKPGSCIMPINMRTIHYQQASIVGAYGCTSRQNASAVEMITQNANELEWLLTFRTNLDEIKLAIDHATGRLGMRAIVNID